MSFAGIKPFRESFYGLTFADEKKRARWIEDMRSHGGRGEAQIQILRSCALKGDRRFIFQIVATSDPLILVRLRCGAVLAQF